MSDDENQYLSANSSPCSFHSCSDSSNESITLGSELYARFCGRSKLFNVCHINAQSIPSHYTDLLDTFSTGCVHAILVSESWLKPSLPSLSYSLPGFVLVRNDRIGRRGGGVAIYLRSSIPYKILSISPSLCSASAEYLFLEVTLSCTKVLLGVVYCPPSTDYFSDLDTVLSSLGPDYPHQLVMGDFNTDLLKDTPRSRQLQSIIKSCCLSILSLNATHRNSSGEDTWLDLILTARDDLAADHGQFLAPGFSRHDLIYVSYLVKPPKSKPRTLMSRCFSGLDIDRLREDAADIDWNPLFTASSVDEKVNCFSSSLLKLYDAHAPLRKIRVKRPPAPWITRYVRMAMNKRNKTFRRYRRDRSDENWAIYKSARNRCNQVVRTAKRRYTHECIDNSSPSDVWKFLRSLGIGKSNNDIDSLPFQLNDLNSHFTHVPSFDSITKTNTLALLAQNPLSNTSPFELVPVTDNDIKKHTLSITSKATGHDGISRAMIVPLLDFLIPIITHIINVSIESGCFPNSWRVACVRPLPKISKPSSLSHFRPISILPFLSKVLESCVLAQLSAFLFQNKLLSPFQSGFRPSHSTATALLKVTEDIRAGIDDHKLTLLVLIDFSNAFSAVDHDLLISIMANLNMSSLTLDWFASYLRGRRQCVKYNETCSDWLDCSAGVPQGGVLSPLLFSIFINYLTHNLDCSYHLYADDLQLYVHSDLVGLNSAIEIINLNLAVISRWSCNFGIAVNPSKCQAIVIGSPRLISRIDFDNLDLLLYDGICIPFSSSVKNLGLHIDSTLSWSVHISEISRKVIASLRSLYRLKFFLPFHTKVLLVHSLILPLIDYADVCFPDLTEVFTDKLERLLNSCIRFIFGLRKYDHVSHYRRELNWLTIRQRRNSRILCMLYTILGCSSAPSYLRDNFHFLFESHDRPLRSSDNLLLCMPSHHSAAFSSSFTIQAARLWNALPVDVRTSPNLNIFKSRLKSLYLV